ncbi:MAG: ABC transporter permease [Erysipelotrichaceae bacterium]|nr:ABC transporter permease [Erysipelotrichaceae bacterium]
MVKWRGKLLSGSYLGLILLFFYLPIIIMIVFSFNSSRSLTIWNGFSLEWYEKLFHSEDMMQAVINTFSIAILATAISTVVGTLTAVGLSKSKRILRECVLALNDLPMLNPDIVTAIGLMLFFTSLRIEKGYVTMLLAHIAFCIPYVILSVLPKLRTLDPNLAEAAMDLGATPWQALMKVIIPQIIPAVISGALIAFTMSLDDFVISYFVTGNGVSNISILVYTMSKRINPTINALSTILVVMITVVLILINVVPLLRKKEGVAK